MSKPRATAYNDDDILSAEAALRLLTEGANGGIWGLVDKILAQEREDKMTVALFDENTSKKFYAGYITAIDMLRGLPALLLQTADSIRARRDAEAQTAAQSRAQAAQEVTKESEASIV